MTDKRIYRGQVYFFDGTEPYTRKDGTTATLLRWRSHCARCGEPFFETTPVGSTYFKPKRTCEAHRQSGVWIDREAQSRQWRYLQEKWERTP